MHFLGEVVAGRHDQFGLGLRLAAGRDQLLDRTFKAGFAIMAIGAPAITEVDDQWQFGAVVGGSNHASPMKDVLDRAEHHHFLAEAGRIPRDRVRELYRDDRSIVGQFDRADERVVPGRDPRDMRTVGRVIAQTRANFRKLPVDGPGGQIGAAFGMLEIGFQTVDL